VSASIPTFADLKARWPLLAGTAAVLVVGAVVLFAGSGQSKQQNARPPIPVAVAKVDKRDVPHMFDVAGTVESLHSVVIRTQVDGVLTSVEFKEGDQVAAGQLLATIDDRAAQAALAAAKAQLARDEAQLRTAERDLQRGKELVAKGAISEAAMDKYIAAADQFRAMVQMDRANVKKAEVDLSYTRIKSPVAGRVGIRRVDPGNVVRATDANGLVTVAQVDPISVVFPVAQAVLGDLRNDVNSNGGGQVEAFDRMTNQVLAHGRITAFDNAVDITTGTAKVRAEFDNKTEALSPGQFVAVRLRTAVSAGVLVVPTVAVRPGLDGNYVFRIKDNVAERVNVSLGYADDKVTVITTGLEAGDDVVVDGVSRLTPGAQVTIKETPQATKAKSAAAAPTLPQGSLMGMQ
jgi:RND family efflux transporter MFP subunit